MSVYKLYLTEGRVNVMQYANPGAFTTGGDLGELALRPLSIRKVYMAFIGCEDVPRSHQKGSMYFDHGTDEVSVANTCGPSINFSVDRVSTYAEMEEEMIKIVICSPGFGKC